MKFLGLVLLCLTALSPFALEAKTETIHKVGNITLIGLRDGIFVQWRKRPVLVRTLHAGSSGFYYKKSDVVLMPKGIFSWLHKKKKKRQHFCYCMVCSPTAMFDSQAMFVDHMKKNQHRL